MAPEKKEKAPGTGKRKPAEKRGTSRLDALCEAQGAPIDLTAVEELVQFLETDTVAAAFSPAGLTDLSLLRQRPDADPDRNDTPRCGFGEVRLISLQSVAADQAADPKERLLVRELVRLFQTGQHEMPLDFSRCTPFQQRVYEVVGRISPGRTVTYKHVAMMLGQPAAARPVGNAMAQTPIVLLVPAHRVVPQSGFKMCRSSAGFLRVRLLEHEGVDTSSLMSKETCKRDHCCMD